MKWGPRIWAPPLRRGRDITLGLAYEFVDLGNAPINVRRGPLAGRLTGDYPTSHIQFVATDLIWRF